MKTRQARQVKRLLYRLGLGACAAAVTLPLALAMAQVVVETRPAAPAVQVEAAGAVPAKAEAKKEEKAESVDPELEKEIAKLKKELEGLKKGTTEHDLKNAEIGKKERELRTKIAAEQRKKQQDQIVENITNGLTLDTDSETDMLLDRAREYSSEGRYRDACVLWQHVLDQKPGLTDREPSQSAAKGVKSGMVLRPVRDLVELELASLPAEGLIEYRITADSEARALLSAAQVSGKAQDEIEGLMQVVRRFFMSSLGDDAAYRLACIQMDEWDFVSARRLLEKIVHSHPDPSIPREDLLLRLALAHAKSGDTAGARQTLKALEAATAKAALPADLMASVQRIVEAGAAVLTATGPVQGWPMALGSAMRDGVMAGLPGKVVQGNALWIDEPVTEYDYKVPDLVGRNQMMGSPQQGTQGRQDIVTRWEKGGWMPVSQVLLKDGKAFFKTHHELRWYDLKTRKLVDVVAQPALKLDSGARIWAQNYYYGPQRPDTPTSTEEIAMFGDRIAKSMTMVGDTLYHLEGRLWLGGPNARIMVWNRNKQSTLEITERLCAVDVSEAGRGKRVKWRYPADDQGQSDLRFLAPPVTAGDKLVVPMMRNGELFLAGIDAATGRELWTTLLGTPPSNDDGSRWATVGVSVLGSEAYVATGYGAILAVDAGAGNILWAARYKRSEPPQQNAQQGFVFGMRGKVELPGWSEDVVIPRGDKLIVLPSDADQVLCFSRLSGRQLWQSPREKASYALGVMGDSLYVAGQKVVRRYGIDTGKLEREGQLKGESHARGALTPQGVYLPMRGEIVRLDPQTLQTAGRLRVASNSRDPVGNLFCDGEHLVAAGLDRIYALSDGDIKMRQLTESIAKADNGRLRLERAFLYEVLGKTQASVEDLRIAFRLLPENAKERTEAAQKLMLGLLEMAVADPDQAQALFDEAERVAAPLKQQVRVWLARGRHHADRGQDEAALDLFLKAAQDTSDALVLVDEEDGRREARASLAAGAEIRAMTAKRPQLSQELARRGEASLKPHLELAELEKRMSEPGAALPRSQDIQRLETELARLDASRQAAQAKIDAADKERKQIEFQVGVEKTNPTGRLEALQKQLADADAALAPLKEALASAVKSHDEKRGEVDVMRKGLAGQLQRLNDLKNNRVDHAERLLALGDLYPDSAVQLKAHLLAARYLWNEDWFERAEMVLRDLSESSNPTIAATGSVALAQGYQSMKWTRQADQLWATVAARHADTAVEQGDGMVKAGDLAKAALGGRSVAADPHQVVSRTMPHPPLERIWSHQHTGHYFLDTDLADPSQFLEEHLLMLHTGSGKIMCKDVSNGQDLWHLSLKRSNYSGTSTTNGRITQFNNYNFPNGRLSRQGHVGLLTAPDRVMAFSLTSGKSLWDVDTLPAPDRQNRVNYYYGGNSPMSSVAIGAGVVVEHGIGEERGQSQVRALDLHTGKVRWIAEFKSDQIIGLNAAHDHVYVFTSNGNEMVICDARTGRRTGRIKFENRQPQYPIEFTRDGLMAVNMQKAVLYGHDGQVRWTANLTNRGNVVFSGYQRIERIDRHRAVILNGGLFLLDLRDGKEIGYISASDMGGRYVNDVAVSPDGKEIIAIGYGNQNEQTISVIDADKAAIKTNISLGPRIGQQIQASKVASSGPLLPVLINDPPKDLGGGRKQYTGLASVAFFRKSDGQRIDVDLPGAPNAHRVQNAQSPLVRGDVFLVMTYQNITAYRQVKDAKPQELKPYVEPPEEKKDDKKGADAQVPPVLPQILPGVAPGGARVIIKGGQIEINGKKIELKEKDKDKKEQKDEQGAGKDDKKGADAKKAEEAKAAAKVQAKAITIEGGAIEIDGDVIILEEILPLPEKPAPAKPQEKK